MDACAPPAKKRTRSPYLYLSSWRIRRRALTSRSSAPTSTRTPSRRLAGASTRKTFRSTFPPSGSIDSLSGRTATIRFRGESGMRLFSPHKTFSRMRLFPLDGELPQSAHLSGTGRSKVLASSTIRSSYRVSSCWGRRNCR